VVKSVIRFIPSRRPSDPPRPTVTRISKHTILVRHPVEPK